MFLEGFHIFNFAFISSGNRTIVVVHRAETYESIRESFKDVLKEINEVQEKGSIDLDGKQIPVELFLGGDYKVSSTSTISNTNNIFNIELPLFCLGS